MTRLAGDQVTVAAQALYGKFDYELDGNGALSGSNPDNAVGWLPGGSAFYTHSISNDLKIGIGTYGNFGLSEDFGSSWAGKNILTKATLMALTIQPTVAYKINDKWSLGGGLTANYGYLKLEREKLTGDTGDTSDGDWAYGARLGVMYTPTESTRVGLAWGSEVTYDFNVDGSVTLLGRTHTIPIASEIKAPQQLMASIYHRLDDSWAVMGNVGWQEWSKFADSTIETDATGTVTSSMQLQDTWHAALGGQYTLDEKTKLNAGVAFDTSMYEDQSETSFMLPSGDAWRFGAGVEYTLSTHSDLGFAVEYLRADSSSDSSTLISGSYDHPEMVFLAANYTYRF